MVSRYFSSRLLLLPQRYVFSSKSQHSINSSIPLVGCCCYHKGTYFQANHNSHLATQCLAAVVVATTKVRIFKQITTASILFNLWRCCCCYHKGTYFQANHNPLPFINQSISVVVATTKVRIFKQITTKRRCTSRRCWLLLLPQRYVFSSKSQHLERTVKLLDVVVATTKVRIFKQITTQRTITIVHCLLLLLPQRYVFSSKSQLTKSE